MARGVKILQRKIVPLWIMGILFLLSGCSSALDTVDRLYPMQDLVYDETGNTSKIFRAYQSSISEVTKAISNEEEPMKLSSSDDRTVLVYDDYLVQIYQDIQNSDDALVEVSDENFVKQNYTTDYFSTYGIADAAEEAYDMDLDDHEDSGSSSSGSSSGFHYSGYVGNSGYVKNTGTPSVRFGSNVSNSVRGGGPGAGK
jgi:hypothetical protein